MPDKCQIQVPYDVIRVNLYTRVLITRAAELGLDNRGGNLDRDQSWTNGAQSWTLGMTSVNLMRKPR